MLKHITAILVLTLVLHSCKKDKPENNNIEIRIENSTTFGFYNFTIDPTGTLSNTPGPNAFNYGDIGVGAVSGYHSYTLAYRYSWVNVNMNGKLYYLRPYDYTGETPLANGKYTYRITHDAGTDRIDITLVED